MNGTPLVTVIVPTYSRPRLLLRAVDSVLRQTYRHLEVLIVDDCSPDDTPLVVRSIRDSRVRYLRHEANRGLPAVRNTGICAARGECIAFLDDDDEWRENKIERQLCAVQGHDAVVCMAISKDGGYAMRVHQGIRISLEDLKRGSFSPSGLLVKTSVLREVMFDESIRQGEDWDAFIRIAQRYSIAWLPEPLLLYNEGQHLRMTSGARNLLGHELERRAAVLFKHREFLGERWFRYHLADTLLSYIGSRPKKFECLAYSVRRCGVSAVSAALFGRVRRRLQRRAWRTST